MDNKSFLEKANAVFEDFKESVRKCNSLGVAAATGLFTGGGAVFMNGALEAYLREQESNLTGVIRPISEEAMRFDAGALTAGVGIAGATYAAILVAKWAVKVSDNLKELEQIKFERGEISNPGNPKGVKGAELRALRARHIPMMPTVVHSDLKASKAMAAQVIDQLNPAGANLQTALDAFQQSEGFKNIDGAHLDDKPSFKNSPTPKMG